MTDVIESAEEGSDLSVVPDVRIYLELFQVISVSAHKDSTKKGWRGIQGMVSLLVGEVQWFDTDTVTSDFPISQ